MALRTWIIRSLILALLASIGSGIWWAQSYVSPEAVRQSLLSTLAEQFPDTDIQVSSAQIRVFGGITVRNLTITQHGTNQPFFHAPMGVIYHDKEQINRGRLAIRKVELDGPTLTVIRQPDGRWSLEGLAQPGANATPLPTFVVSKATVRVIDQSQTDRKLPALTLTEANFTLVNDPAPLFLNIKGSALASISEKFNFRFSISSRLNRANSQLTLKTEIPEVAVGPETAGLLGQLDASLVEPLKALTGKGSLKGELIAEPGLVPRYEVQVTLREGRFEEPSLPAPLEKIEVRATLKNGKVTLEKGTAKLGKSSLDLTFESRNPQARKLPETLPIPGSTAPPAKLASRQTSQTGEPSVLEKLEDQLERLNFVLHDLTIDDALFERLPDELKKIQQKFSPGGTASFGYRFQRPTAETWRRELDFRPTNISINYEKFQYPLSSVSGLIRQTVTPENEEATIELTGTAGGQRVNMKGVVRGKGLDPFIQMKITGTNIPLDDRLFDALHNKKYPPILKKLGVSGRADFVVEVKQQAGVNFTENTFRIDVSDGKLNYKQFPYPLEKIRGSVNMYITTNDASRPIRPGEEIKTLPDEDRFEVRQMTGTHAGGTVEIQGEKLPVGRNSNSQKLLLSIRAKDCPIDEHFRDSLTAIKLGDLWTILRPRGKLTCAVNVEVMNRTNLPTRQSVGPLSHNKPITAYEQLRSQVEEPPDPPFDPATDLKLAFNFTGPSVTPEFFNYRLDDLAGQLTFDGTSVKLVKLSARHGPTKVDLQAAEIHLFEDGRVRANLGKLGVNPVIVDEPFLAALPKSLADGMKDLNLTGPAELTLNHMIILTPEKFGPNAEANPELFWKGELRFLGSNFDVGVPCERAVGKLACSGRYHSTHLGKVSGNIWLDNVQIANHPFTNFKASFDADPQELDPRNPGERLPPVFKFTDMNATLFNGIVGGTARVVLSSPARYRLSLTATDIRLEDVAAFHNLGNGARLEGAAQGSLLLETTPDPTGNSTVLTGYGKADVDRGHIYNLPALVALLKALKLQAPDKTAFEEAHAVFTVRGDRLKVDHLDLLGTAISLGGAGEMDVAGKYVKFDFYTIWSQTLQRWLTTPFGDVTAMVSEKLFKIEVSRKPDGEMKYEPRVVPFVTDPFKAIAERVKARTARQPTARATQGK